MAGIYTSKPGVSLHVTLSLLAATFIVNLCNSLDTDQDRHTLPQHAFRNFLYIIYQEGKMLRSKKYKYNHSDVSSELDDIQIQTKRKGNTRIEVICG